MRRLSTDAFEAKQEEEDGSGDEMARHYLLYRDGDWGFIVCLGIVYSKFGLIAAIIGFLLFPTVLYLAPFYAGATDGNWFPAMLVYGGTFISIALALIGSLIERK